jgi:hypothetical protein
MQDQHCEALRALSKEVMDLIDTLPAKIIRLSSMSDGTGDADKMGYTMTTWTNNLIIYIYICNNINSIY